MEENNNQEQHDFYHYDRSVEHKHCKFYAAYAYPKSNDNPAFYDEVVNKFKPGQASEKVKMAYMNMVTRDIAEHTRTLKDSVIAFMPCSSPERTANRWNPIIDYLSQLRLNINPKLITNEHTYKTSNATGTHVAYNMVDDSKFDDDAIRGKKVILLDDIITKGEHVRQFADELYNRGARDVSIVCLCATLPKVSDTRTQLKLDSANDFEVPSQRLYNPKEYVRELNRIYNDEIQLTLNFKENMNEKENEKEQQTAQQPKVKSEYPDKVNVGFANQVKITNDKNEAKPTADVRFNVSMSLQKALDLTPRITKSQDADGKEKQHQWIDLSLIRRTPTEKSPSGFELIARRDGKPAVSVGRQVDFADRNAVINIRIERGALLDKMKELNLTKDDKISLTVGTKDNDNVKVRLNGNVYKETPKEKLEVLGGGKVTNYFQTAINAERNLKGESFPQQNRYDTQYVGAGYGRQTKDAQGNPEFKGKSQDNPFMTYNINIDKAQLKKLPLSDQFGNVTLAIVKRDLSADKLAKHDLHMDASSPYPLNKNNKPEPNYHVIADSKTYKNGEPNAHTVAVIRINKQDLMNMPGIKETYNTQNGQQTKETLKLSVDKFGGVTPNVYAYKFAEQNGAKNAVKDLSKYVSETTGTKVDFSKDTKAADVPKMNASTQAYSPAIASKERQDWEAKVGYSTPEYKQNREAQKDLPNQFDVFKVAAENMQKEVQARTQKAQEKAEGKSEKQADTPEQTKKESQDAKQESKQDKGFIKAPAEDAAETKQGKSQKPW